MKKHSRILALVFAVLMMISALYGCTQQAVASTGEQSGDNGSATAAASQKDTLVVLSAEAFSGSWDPGSHTVLANCHLQWVVLSNLLNKNYDTGEIGPGLATEWEFLDDGYSVQFKLRDDVTFHDGSTFDGYDVKATIEHMSDPKGTRGGDWGQQYLVDVIDPYTVRIYPSSETPQAIILNMLSLTGILSADDVANPEKLKSGLNGTGPYKMEKYENETVYLTRFENYYDKADMAKIKNVEYRYVPESQTRLAALQSGEADLIDRVETEQLEIVKADPNLAYVVGNVNEQKYMVFKTTQAPMDNPLVRKAIAYAIDVDTIVNDIMNGYARKADSWLPASAANYTACEDFITYDVEKAKALLVEAGYPNGEGLPTLKYITSTGFYPKTKEYGEYIVSCLNEIGIQVDFQPMESAGWSEALYQEDSCHMIDTGWMNESNEDNIALYVCYHTTGLMDFSSNADVDAALLHETATMDAAARKQVIHDELWPALNANMSTFPLFDSTCIYVYNAALQGFKVLPTSSMSFWQYSFEG
ncbi:MAG: ABC transporter substrate-binding protein [Eubacteriales bacterium]|nr:ABC transporter substrate-binding protein [Eubacteriales bacterium]